jgi:hypothetical protein
MHCLELPSEETWYVFWDRGSIFLHIWGGGYRTPRNTVVGKWRDLILAARVKNLISWKSILRFMA